MPIELTTSACCLPKLTRGELFKAAHEAGYRWVELFTGNASKYDPAGEPADAFSAHGVGVSALHLPGDLAKAKQAVDLAAKLGVPQAIAHGAGAPAEAGRWLAPTVAYAKACGVEVVVTNHKGQSIESPEDVAAVLKACGPDAPQVLLEAGHYWAAGLDASEALKRFRDRVRLVHVKDLDAHGRSVPYGTGAAPLDAFIQDLAASGYQGRLCVELEMRELHTAEIVKHLSDARFVVAAGLGVAMAGR
ncbi:MAG: sugar phosphate isomerase/epimerase [Planctomycetota bacterium]|nr:sugar phosphate isomerase/epimerase [Planctomycetota bacterium]